MKRTLYYLSLIVILVGFFACGKQTPATKEAETSQSKIDSLQREKEQLNIQLEEQRKKIDAEIADLRDKRNKSTEKRAQEMYDESINKLTASRDSLQVKMDRFGKETEKDWNQLKKEMNEAVDQAGKELDDVGKAIEEFFK